MSSPAPSPSAVPSGPELDRPVWYALTGRHAALAQPGLAPDGTVLAARYHPDVSPFAAVGEIRDPAGWAALATTVEPGGRCVVMVPFDATAGIHPWPPAGWTVVMDLPGVQMVARDMRPEADPGASVLGPGDVPEMLELIARTRPGPFEKRTIELGGYLGIRAGARPVGAAADAGPGGVRLAGADAGDRPGGARPVGAAANARPGGVRLAGADAGDRPATGRLVAMAGRRFAPAGFVEISAVCTDADHRRLGLGSRLVRAVAAGIVADGDVPFLHAAATNPAIALYEELGMVVRLPVRFIALQRVEPG